MLLHHLSFYGSKRAFVQRARPLFDDFQTDKKLRRWANAAPAGSQLSWFTCFSQRPRSDLNQTPWLVRCVATVQIGVSRVRFFSALESGLLNIECNCSSSFFHYRLLALPQYTFGTLNRSGKLIKLFCTTAGLLGGYGSALFEWTKVIPLIACFEYVCVWRAIGEFHFSVSNLSLPVWFVRHDWFICVADNGS